MEQQNQKRNSKEKVARTSESDDRDGIVVDEHFRTRFQFMESRLEAQENVQKDLIERLTHMESNVGEIKTKIEDNFAVTYRPGESYVVHTNRGDVTFSRRNKLYEADAAAF